MVRWTDNKTFYTTSITQLHLNGEVFIFYDNGDIDRINLTNETWNHEYKNRLSASSVNFQSSVANPSVVDY